MKTLISVMALLSVALTAGAQGIPESKVTNFDQVVNRAIRQENALLAILRTEHPIAETYIQDLGKDSDFGTVPTSDHYFLSKVDLADYVKTDSFMPKPGTIARKRATLTQPFSIRFMPRGF